MDPNPYSGERSNLEKNINTLAKRQEVLNYKISAKNEINKRIAPGIYVLRGLKKQLKQ